MGNTLGALATRPVGRLLFADWLRGWALLVMIETHVFNAFLAPEFRPTSWFSHLNFINGLVAPSFLFVSGFVFLVATQKRLEELRTLGKAFWKQIGRVAIIWAIAYIMHLPADYLRKVDVLHCIALTWLFLLLSLIAIRSERLQRAWLTACIAALSGLAPLVYSLELRPALPTPLAAYFNDKTQSLFPIFPWSAFMLAGTLCASVFLPAKRRGREWQCMTGVAVVGAAMALLGYFLPPLRFLPQAEAATWKADPRTFLLRLGIVLLLLGACWLYGVFRSPSKSVLLDVSRESLLVYVAHLTLIYKSFWGGGSLAYRVARTWSPLECGLATMALAAMMIGAARGWGAIKRRRSLPR
jgi:uncharacterized membrane protein